MTSDRTAGALKGWTAIGQHFGIKPDAARHWWKKHGMPTFTIGKTRCATVAALDAWWAERQAARSDA